MGYKITTAQNFSVELKDYVSLNALCGKELKSLSKSIGYPLGFLNGLFNFHNRAMLTNELVFLNAFLGSVTLRLCFSEHHEFEQDMIDTVVQMLTRELLSQWLPDSMFQDFRLPQGPDRESR